LGNQAHIGGLEEPYLRKGYSLLKKEEDLKGGFNSLEVLRKTQFFPRAFLAIS